MTDQDLNRFLILEEINSILSEKDRLLDRVERSVFITNSGELAPVVNSKLYSSESLWYSVVKDHFKDIGAKYIYFTCSVFGILKIPVEILDKYCKYSGWKQLNKGRSYYVRVKIREHKFYLFCSELDDIDVNEYFIPFPEGYSYLLTRPSVKNAGRRGSYY